MRKGLTFVTLLLLLVVATSCNKHSQLLYLKSQSAATLPKAQQEDYRISPKDEIYIQITSTLNKEINALFSNSNTTPNTMGSMLNSDVGVYINTYSVNDSGYVEVPLIGKIDAAGKTINEFTASVKKKALEYINDAVVVVKLMSFRVAVIGEVKKPTVITNYHDRLSILEAIAQAGDMTDFADRQKVTIVRNIKGENTTIAVDLNSRSLLTNPGYNLQPGDVVIVDPRKGKTTQMNIPTYSIFLTSISTLVLLLNYIR
ncbi:polysaccharide biosynthesis/export family protein [Acetobacteroides hydrogenigenes]|uniref:Polysaccharide export outer membrane protein n=1 Tax=Acetobacteroides hydrogenigenes TaxID=979970 RepID=A0A4V2RQM7_9BACT|nr:polysaccharide biosynthesis/export family protein [Acetobacteroides hydrogenigenes]TCN72120.1 polysaccharide export outer membrane protein [Acetobacteroides hydrogenigenes]